MFGSQLDSCLWTQPPTPDPIYNWDTLWTPFCLVMAFIQPGLDSHPMTPVVLTDTHTTAHCCCYKTLGRFPYLLAGTSWYWPHFSLLYKKTLCLRWPGVSFLMASPLLYPNFLLCCLKSQPVLVPFLQDGLCTVSQKPCSYVAFVSSLLCWSFS